MTPEERRAAYWKPHDAAPPPPPHLYWPRRPEQGELLGVHWKAWRVVEVRDVEPADWTDLERQEWALAGMPDPWPHAPFVVHAFPADEPAGRRYRLRVPGGALSAARQLPRLREHYAVCRSCGELSPCREIDRDRVARAELTRLAEVSSTMPGCCWGCRKPITERQATLHFEGPNLLYPLAEDGVTFHAKADCRQAAQQYEERWVRADPTRPRSLLTLACPGRMTVHHGGEGECSEADCPSMFAWHASWSACYAIDGGACSCGPSADPTRGPQSMRAGHPGTRLRKPTPEEAAIRLVRPDNARTGQW